MCQTIVTHTFVYGCLAAINVLLRHEHVKKCLTPFEVVSHVVTHYSLHTSPYFVPFIKYSQGDQI